MDRPLYREDVILDPVVIDFYRQLEAPEPEHQEVTLSIPKEHEAAVLALLARLQKKEAAPHPRDDDTPLLPLTVENEPDELEKITGSPDIDHLLAVYRNQTGEEQQGRKTNRENGIGFNKNDAPILSELAETFLAKGCLTRSELQTVSRKIQKYRKQWE